MIFFCQELCQHQPQSWNKECAFALMKQLSHSPLLLPTTTILHRYLWVRENICRLINSTNTRLSFGVHILHRLVWHLNIYLTRAIIWTNNLCSSLLDNYWRWCTLMDRYRNPLLFSGENLAHIYVETSHWCPQNSLYQVQQYIFIRGGIILILLFMESMPLYSFTKSAYVQFFARSTVVPIKFSSSIGLCKMGWSTK